MSTLLVDGDNLLTIGFHAVKHMNQKTGETLGGVYHVVNTLRRFIEDYQLNKIVVFWDGVNGTLPRKKIYSHYKTERGKKEKTQEEIDSYNRQRIRTKQYLEELFVRQGEYEFCEADDCIAQYCKDSVSEKIIIFSSDGDLAQLVSDRVSIYNPGPKHRRIYEPNDQYIFERHSILIENVKIAKMICGDSSDSIAGIKGVGPKKFVEIFPEVIDTPITLNFIRERAEELFIKNKKSKTYANILNGVTKHGILEEEFYTLNEQLISLDTPLTTEEAKKDIQTLIYDNIDPEGRSYRQAMRYMIEDSFDLKLPKYDEAWVKFFNPFLRLTRKEKNKRKINLNEYQK